MSGKKYDLSQVSQATKDAYCQVRIDFEIARDAVGEKKLKYIGELMCQEAEVKPKTAREILEEYLSVTEDSDSWVDDRGAIAAIYKALKVLP